MKLVDFLSPELVLPELTADRKTAVLAELAAACSEHVVEVDTEDLVRVLRDRERLGSTGVGEGVALPHGKLAGLPGLLVCFGRHPAGLDFEAQDGEPVHLFFLLVAPESSSGLHLKLLARISRLCKQPAFRQKLLEAPDADALFALISTEDARL